MVVEMKEKELDEFIWISNMFKKIECAINDKIDYDYAARLLLALITESEFKFEITCEYYGFSARFTDEIEITGTYGYFIEYEYETLKEYFQLLSESCFNFETAARKFYDRHYEF